MKVFFKNRPRCFKLIQPFSGYNVAVIFIGTVKKYLQNKYAGSSKLDQAVIFLSASTLSLTASVV